MRLPSSNAVLLGTICIAVGPDTNIHSVARSAVAEHSQKRDRQKNNLEKRQAAAKAEDEDEKMEATPPQQHQ